MRVTNNLVPEEPRYFEVRKLAIDTLLSCKFAFIPVSPAGIMMQLFKGRIAFMNYSRLANIKKCSIDKISDELQTKDAVTHKINGKYLIIYNDTILTEERQRFTLAHELGHIICGHLELDEDLMHLPDHKHEILEKEANAFASELLAPTFLLQFYISIGSIKSWHGVKQNFCVSQQEAQILFERARYPSNKEIALYRCDEILTNLVFMQQKNTLAPTRVSSNRKL